MKIFINKNKFSKFSITIERNEYDGIPPICELLIDGIPRNLHPDRLAIASYLAFGSYASGSFILPEKFSPAVAERIELDSQPTSLRCSPLEFYPKGLPMSSNEASVNISNVLERSSTPHISVAPSDRYSGILIGQDKIFVSSNAFLIDSMSHRPNSVRARLAVATLFAEDIGVDTFNLMNQDISVEEQDSLRHLLSSCRLGVSFI